MTIRWWTALAAEGPAFSQGHDALMIHGRLLTQVSWMIRHVPSRTGKKAKKPIPARSLTGLTV